MHYPAGLAFSPVANAFHVVEARRATEPLAPFSDIVMLTPVEDRAGSARIAAAITDPINMTFDASAGRLLILQSTASKLIEIAVGPDGYLDPATLTCHNARDFGQDPQGMAVDPESGHLFVLDAAGPSLVQIEPQPDGSFDSVQITEVDLQSAGLADPRGLAFDPATGHFHVLSVARQELVELTATGRMVAIRDLSSFGLGDAQAMVFAPSGDLTDDPMQTSLYLADSGQPQATASLESSADTAESGDRGQSPGQIVELSFDQPQAPDPPTFVASLIQTIDAWQFSPPSPDSAGITYIGPSNTLLIADSEVDEMPIFTGDNLFEATLSGNLLDTLTTIPFSYEPTGAGYNPGNGHLYFSDDNNDHIYEMDPGPDGHHGTADDIITSFGTKSFGSTDPEGIAFGVGSLFIVDGINHEVYQVSPGTNGIFDGKPPGGDDDVTSFDTESLGIRDPEGIAFNSDTGHLYIMGEPENRIAEITTGGTLVRMIDTSAAPGVMPAGLAYGPSSYDAAVMGIYITDRGVDNGADPKENDGKVYEMTLPSGEPGNQPPTVDAGPDQAITLPDSANLDGTISDDGLPDPPGTVSASWSKVSGPGTVTFADANAVDTTASFSTAGIYVLRLTAYDGALAASDELTIIASGGSGTTITEVRVAASSDDAEEEESGKVSLSSSDLEFVYDDGNQTVGMRFNGVEVPPGATIAYAYLQFQVDETSSGETSLNIQGQDNDNATAFTYAPADISSRPRTAASVSWSPPPWTTVGEAGLDQRTPDIGAVIQEIVNRSGWSSGNSLAIIITGTGERTAESYNGDQDGAALLHIEYTTGPVNQPPSVTINTPADGATFTEGDSITFTGSGSDAEDGDVTSSLAWVSSLDGSIGSGGSFSRSDLSVGTHTITATATDSGGLGGEDTIAITVEVANTSPVATITAPADGATFTEGDSITFTGSGSDAEDGDVTSSLAWVSNLDGAIGSGGSFSRSNLSVGVHTITATATDSGGLSGEDTIALTVEAANTPPVATITAPADGATFTEGDAITFTGSGTDAEDGDLTASLVWVSSIDGTIGTGGTFSRSDLSVGVHTITATTTDSGGLSGEDTIAITVEAANTSPVATITAPADGATFTEGEAISFTGSASDAEDGDVTASLAWVSSLNGSIGSGGTFSRSDLSVGTHTITATATDSGNLTGSAEITITIVSPNTPPTATISAPADGTTFTEGDSITFTGSGSDAEDGDVTASLTWMSSIDGAIGTGGTFSRSDLSVGTHTITATATDSGGLTGSAEVAITVAPSFNPSDDAMVSSKTPTLNEGSATTLELRAQSKETIQSYLKFTISGLNGTVKSAKLRLYAAKSSSAGGAIYLVSNDYAGTSTPWTEDGLTWNNAPILGGAPLSTVAAVAADSWVEFDVTDAILGDGVYSFGLNTDSRNRTSYNSKEATGNHPILVVEIETAP